MDIYKDFIQQLRRLAFDGVYILLCDITPNLSEYVLLLTEVKFEDGSYYSFYGNVKKIINSFLVYYNNTIDETIKMGDSCINNITKDELLTLMEQTISTHQRNQIEFGNNFLPVKSEREKIIYEDIQLKYDNFMKQLFEFRAKLEMIPKQEKVVEFAEVHFKIVIKKTSEVLQFAHTYLAMLLADCINKTRTSLEENELRIRNNLSKQREQCTATVDLLLNQLYDKNKEKLFVSRRAARSSVDEAEVDRGVQNIRNKIDAIEAEYPLRRLEDELIFWQKKLTDFNEVAANLIKLKAEQEDVAKQEQIYYSMKSTELPGTKLQCWENMAANFTARKAYLKEKLLLEARAMLTFYACRGSDRIFYTDNVGPYYLDEYNHKVYVFDHGLRKYHVSCEGNYSEVPGAVYYFDKYGRYTFEGGKKIYQCEDCTSQFQLTGDNLRTKVSKDCGHGERINNQCKMAIRDPNDVAILPNFDPVDIKGTLDNDTVKYLWDNFGSLLPDALHDVGVARPKNPIHLLAHKLLHHKYKRTWTELRQEKTKAEELKANIFKDRQERAEAASRAWRAQLPQRRAPEEADDVDARAENAQLVQRAFIDSLDYYN